MKRLALGVALTALVIAAANGCGDDVQKKKPPVDDGGPGGSGGGEGGEGGQGGDGGDGGQGGDGASGAGYACTPTDIGAPPAGPTSDKVDLLFVVDNSRAMHLNQQVLNLGVDQLINRFTNPRCVDANGAPTDQPASPGDACGSGSREFAPVQDMHIGVISTSIGGHGADVCQGNFDPSENDKGQLIDRSLAGPPVPTYQNQKYLWWDAAAQVGGETDVSNLVANTTALIEGAGSVGCGYEAQNESWYRFLIDPDPYDNITIEGNTSAVLNGTDAVLLGQRAAFMRPDSTLVIVMLTDENDCSTRDGGQFYFANQQTVPGTNNPYHLPRPRAACAVDPNDPCCRSCGQSPGDGCDTSQDDCSSPLSNSEDNTNLRCFDQKRRFGIDFMWPISRYVEGLTQSMISDRHGNIVNNPLFAGGRSPSQVYLTGIVGVPWQNIARREAGAPNLDEGLQNARDMGLACTWDVILGDPDNDVAPLDPHMIESIDARSGINPITGDPIGNSAINGNEYTIEGRNDLQYACIHALPTPVDCSTGAPGCDCNAGSDNPLCQGETQHSAKAYPGRRQLQLLRDLGHQGIVGSICAPQIDDAGGRDYAFVPVFDAIADSAKRSL